MNPEKPDFSWKRGSPKPKKVKRVVKKLDMGGKLKNLISTLQENLENVGSGEVERSKSVVSKDRIRSEQRNLSLIKAKEEQLHREKSELEKRKASSLKEEAERSKKKRDKLIQDRKRRLA